MKKFNPNDFTWFVVVGEGLDTINRGGSISLRGYTDHAGAVGDPGKYVQFVTSKDERGRDKGKWFVLDESRRKLQVRDSDVDVHGMTQYDFLKNYPDCEGSPNGTYQEVDGVQVQTGVLFRELDTNKDAEVALAADSTRIEAQSSVLKLDNVTLQEVASFIGIFGEADSLMKMKVFEWAGKKPQEYLDRLKSSDRGVRAIVKKALATGLFTQKGSIIYWGTNLMGADEDATVAQILRDPDMFSALKQKVNLDTPVQPVKKRAGRSVGSKSKPKEPVETK